MTTPKTLSALPWQPEVNQKWLRKCAKAKIHTMSHRLSGMEAWVSQHQHILEKLTGWTVTPKDATDDRLGLLIEAFGTDLERLIQYQMEQGASIVQAYALPTA